jgi:hypothetical protein
MAVLPPRTATRRAAVLFKLITGCLVAAGMEAMCTSCEDLTNAWLARSVEVVIVRSGTMARARCVPERGSEELKAVFD